MKIRLTAAIALSALMVTACGSVKTTSAVSDAFESVQVTGTNGRIIVTGTDDRPVVVMADASSDVNVTSEVRDGVLIIEHDCTDCDVDYEIEVPSDVDVQVTHNDGTVLVANISGGVAVTSAKGNVTLRTLSGTIDATSDDGNILGLRLTGSPASFTVGTGNVDVSFDGSVGVLNVTVTDGDITVQAPGGPYNVVATTADGGIDTQVAVDAGSSATMTLTTGKGDITVYAD